MTPPEFVREFIWGNDEETVVFAQGYGADLTVIFSFSLVDSKSPTSLASRICNSFHGLDTTEAAATFPTPMKCDRLYGTPFLLFGLIASRIPTYRP